jgi:hypothetical protein
MPSGLPVAREESTAARLLSVTTPRLGQALRIDEAHGPSWQAATGVLYLCHPCVKLRILRPRILRHSPGPAM